MMKRIAPALLLFALCAGAGGFARAEAVGKSPALNPVLNPAETRGLAFARPHCAACHAVVANGTSPMPEAPPFADIANRPGVTRETLAQFLRDSHNFPEAMNFRVEPRDIDDLADYMLTLREAGYRPAIQ